MSNSDWDSPSEAENLDNAKKRNNFISSKPEKDRNASDHNIRPTRSKKFAAANERTHPKPKKRSGPMTFVDPELHHDSQMPPFNFKGVTSDGDNSQRDFFPPGKPKKGNNYDPNSEEESVELNSDDEAERTLASLREGMKKSQTPKELPPQTVSPSSSDLNKAEQNISNNAAQEDHKDVTSSLRASKSALRNFGNKLSRGMKHDLLKGSPSRSQEQLVSHSKSDTESIIPTSHNMMCPVQPSHERKMVSFDTASLHPPTTLPDIYSLSPSDARSTYYFERGVTEYLVPHQDVTPSTISDFADRSELAAYRVWRECFAVLRFPLDFIIIFFLELVRFLFRGIFLQLVVGLITIIGDYGIKPVLAALFSSFIQPSATLLANVAISLRQICEPLFAIIHSIAVELAVVLRAFRLVEWNGSYGTRDQFKGTTENV